MRLRESLALPKEVKPVVVYDVERGIALETMQRNRVSSRVDFGYPEPFLIPAVTSMSFYIVEGVLGNS